MIKIFSCRRSSLALIAIIGLVLIAFNKGHDVSMAISGIILSVAGANAYEKKGSSSEPKT